MSPGLGDQPRGSMLRKGARTSMTLYVGLLDVSLQARGSGAGRASCCPVFTSASSGNSGRFRAVSSHREVGDSYLLLRLDPARRQSWGECVQ